MAKVSDVLEQKSKRVVFVGPESTVSDALNIMATENIGAVLVLDGEKVAGIFSERDLARSTAEAGYDPSTPVIQLMTKRVFYVSPADTLESCMAQMTDKRIRHLPVIDNNKVSGVISIGDVVRTMIGEYKQLVRSLENYIVGVESQR